MNDINGIIGQILQACLRINQETERCVFLSISGHVGKVEVYITVSKKDFQTRVYESDAYSSLGYDPDFSDERSIERLSTMLSELQQYLPQ